MSIRHLTFDDSGTLPFGSLTNTYQSLLALSDDADFVFFFNSTDKAVLFSVPSGAGATKNLRLPAYCSMTIDCRSNSKRIAKGIIQVKYDLAPSVGEVTVTVAR